MEYSVESMFYCAHFGIFVSNKNLGSDVIVDLR